MSCIPNRSAESRQRQGQGTTPITAVDTSYDDTNEPASPVTAVDSICIWEDEPASPITAVGSSHKRAIEPASGSPYSGRPST